MASRIPRTSGRTTISSFLSAGTSPALRMLDPVRTARRAPTMGPPSGGCHFWRAGVLPLAHKHFLIPAAAHAGLKPAKWRRCISQQCLTIQPEKKKLGFHVGCARRASQTCDSWFCACMLLLRCLTHAAMNTSIQWKLLKPPLKTTCICSQLTASTGLLQFIIACRVHDHHCLWNAAGGIVLGSHWQRPL